MLSQLFGMLTRPMWLPLGLHLGYAHCSLSSITIIIGCLIVIHLQQSAVYLQSLSNIMDASMEDLARCPGIGERKVKRLHDTFHEPFRRVISSQPVIPETTFQKGSDAPSVNEIVELEREREDVSKCGNREPEMTVKSALSMAFAKYADKFGKKNGKSLEEKMGETSDAVEPEAASGTPGEGAAD
uniref:DNA excision repair protein ERCC-1 n=1 Tax=Rhizophora mucronata TaxID=61149 RepID=A0A2P2L6F6_RHIMU